MTILLAAALLPPIVLMIWIYRMDKVEPEPPGLVLKVLLLGALTTIPAGFIEMAAERLLNGLVSIYYYPLLYYFLLYFLIVAWTEEGVKHFALKIGSWKHPAFNYRFDGVIYSVAAALGFAAAENISYVLGWGGLQVAALRAVTAIPGHCIFGIYMGYYYGQAKYWAMQGDRGKQRMYQFLSIFMPLLLHGFYDFCATFGDQLMTVVFLVYIIILDIFAVKNIRRFARTDEHIPGTSEEASYVRSETASSAGYGQGTQGRSGSPFENGTEPPPYGGPQGGPFGSDRGIDPDDPAGIGPLSKS